jgi:hypothetical protein
VEYLGRYTHRVAISNNRLLNKVAFQNPWQKSSNLSVLWIYRFAANRPFTSGRLKTEQPFQKLTYEGALFAIPILPCKRLFEQPSRDSFSVIMGAF